MSDVGVALSFSCLLLSVSPFPAWGTMAWELLRGELSGWPLMILLDSKDLVLTLIVSLHAQ